MVLYLMEVDVTEEALEVLILIVVEDGLVQIDGEEMTSDGVVLILIVVEDGLVRLRSLRLVQLRYWVLILIVVEDGLVLHKTLSSVLSCPSLNPYCSGRWSRTQ